MAKITLVKKSAAKPHAAAGTRATPGDFILLDNEDGTATVMGASAAGNPVDISAVATIAVTSSDTTIITVDPPTGMMFAMHAVGKLSVPGTPVSVTVVASWNDGSIGPFTATLPVDVVTGPAASIVIKPGVPTVH
jgi:hypothetical protein